MRRFRSRTSGGASTAGPVENERVPPAATIRARRHSVGSAPDLAAGRRGCASRAHRERTWQAADSGQLPGSAPPGSARSRQRSGRGESGPRRLRAPDRIHCRVGPVESRGRSDPEPDEAPMSDYPQPIVPVNHVEPVPRRIRATLGGSVVIDSRSALYVWEWPHYPQYYIPLADVDPEILIDEEHEEHLRRGTARRLGLRAGTEERRGVAHHYTASDIDGITGTVRFDWSALDGWFEEQEQVFVHPRIPTPGWTHCVRTAGSGSSWTASSSPSRRARSRSSKPGCRPGTTSTGSTSTSSTSGRATRSPPARTRGRPAATGRWPWVDV